MMDTINGGMIATRRPGLLELLDTGRLNEDQPLDVALPITTTSRGSAQEISRRWRTLVRWLQGYQAEDLLVHAEPIWIPIIEIYVPPSGSANLTYERMTSQTASPEIKIFGIGFGNTSAITFDESVSIEAKQTGKALQVKMLIAARRYIHPTKAPLIRVDIESPAERVEYRVIDIEADNDMQPIDLKNSLEWEIIQSVDLSASRDSGHYTWQYKTGERSNWKIGLGLSALAALNLDLKVELEVEQAQAFSITYELPYGRDYLFYQRVGESPLTPRCALRR